MSDHGTFTASEVRDWLIAYVAQLLGMEAKDVDPAFSFERYGLDSSAAVGISGDLGDLLGCKLEVSLAYDHPTIDAVVDHLASRDIVSVAP